MLAAYILIQLGTEATADSLDQLRGIDGVQHAHIVFGPTDCIAFIEAPDMGALLQCAMAIRGVAGVEATDTRLAVM